MPATPGGARLLEALARELGDACAALLGETTITARVDAGGDAAWLATISCAGRLAGTITLGLPEADGRRLSSLIMGMDEAPDDAVLDTLREICGQAVGSLSLKEPGQGLTLAVGEVRPSAGRGIEASDAFEFSLSGGSRSRVFLHADLTSSESPAAPEQTGTSVSPGTPVRLQSAGPGPAVIEASALTTVSTQNLNVLLDVELPVSVRFGQTELPLVALVRLGPGSVIDLRRTADEPVDVLVSGKVIARGEVVVVDGNYGVRVTEIVSTAERIRTLGA